MTQSIMRRNTFQPYYGRHMRDHKIHAVLRPTRAYSSFSFNDYNRDVIPSHVDRLEEAVAEQNLLDLYPLVTTAERVIVDGQNRFCMARNLMIPFYYMAGEDLSVGDITASNELTLSYSEDDVLRSYGSMGIEPYVMLSGFLDKFRRATDYKIGRAARWLSSRSTRPAFVRGDFVIDQMAWAEKIASCIGELREYSKVFASTSYHTAIKRMMLTGKYDHQRMMGRVEKASRKLVHCGEVEHAIAVLQEVYNYNIPAHNRIDFLSLVSSRRTVPLDDRIFVNELPFPQRQIEQIKESAVYVTSDYSLFSRHPSLRPLRQVDRLRDYMQQRNLLQYYPIIVNEQFEIIDGQRRYQAAKELRLPIYFLVSGNFSVWMATVAGGTRKSWSIDDYASSYAKQGLPEYVWAERIRSLYSAMSPSLLMRIHRGAYDDWLRRFRLGHAKFDHQYIENFCRQWGGVESERRWLNTSVLIIATLQICNYGESMDRLPRLIQIINRNWDDVFSVRMPLAYTSESLLELYNKGLRTTSPAISRSTTPGVGVYRPQPAA